MLEIIDISLNTLVKYSMFEFSSAILKIISQLIKASNCKVLIFVTQLDLIIILVFSHFITSTKPVVMAFTLKIMVEFLFPSRIIFIHLAPVKVISDELLLER